MESSHEARVPAGEHQLREHRVARETARRVVHPGHVKAVVAAEVLAEPRAEPARVVGVHGARRVVRARHELQPVVEHEPRHDAIRAPSGERPERVHLAPEVRARRERQDDDVVRQRRPDPAIPQQALRQAVAVDTEVDDLEPRVGRFEHRRPGRLLWHAAPGGERVAEDEHPRRAGSGRGGGVAASAGADVVRLPPSVRRDRVLPGRVAEDHVVADEAAQIVEPDAPRLGVASRGARRLRRDELHGRQLAAEEPAGRVR